MGGIVLDEIKFLKKVINLMRSILTVVSSASSYDLTDLTTVKLELGISDNDQDELLSLLIRQASSAISNLCDRVFLTETVQEVFRINSGNVGRWHYWVREEGNIEGLILRRRPISSIIDVIEDTITVDSSEYECNFDTGLLYRLTSDDFRTIWTANKITVDYVSGWDFEDLPADLSKACLLWVKSLKAQLKRSDTTVKVEDVPDVMRKEFFDPSRTSVSVFDPPPEVMMLLNPYIEVAIR
jgi:hypothetical protein